MTDLIRAIWEGRIDAVRELLEGGADPDAEVHGTTALREATIKGRPDVVRLLLERGAKADVLDGSGKTPLDRAIQRGHTDIARLLQAHKDVTL
jgi:ankyrin repeat protein